MRVLLLQLLFALVACQGEEDAGKTVGDTGGGNLDDDTDTQDTDTGTAADAPDIDVSPTSLDLGLAVSGEAVTGTFTVSNVGTQPLTASIAVTTGDPTFRVNTTGAYLVAGGSTEVTVTMLATEVGSYTGAVTLTSDDPVEPTVVVALSGVVDLDSDGDGWADSEDCDPDDPTINPGADETWYDGIDQDCDGGSDYDQDGDGYDSAQYGGTDCDDGDASVNPAASETWYDGVDSNCDGRSDYDQDGDGYDSAEYGGTDCDDTNPDASPGTLEVEGNGIDDDCDGNVDEARNTEDLDGDGYSEVDGDCNDSDASIYPGADETWYDGVDQNCDGLSDYDQDGDGFDSVDYGGTDCDDTDPSVNPDATEVYYDGVDQDCDGASDYDADLDGYDSSDYGGDDCDDTDASVNPGADDDWYDGIDSNCDGLSDYDQDGDGYDSVDYGGSDCDDSDANINPGATEVCDGIDQDCDGTADNGVQNAYYTDADGDGYGDPATIVYDCSAPAGMVTKGTDCDDTDASINPLATEVCDSIDNDCDGVVDEGVKTKYYKDADGDGYGTPSTSKNDCSAPSGYVSNSDDCDDTDASINPAGTEICDGLDNDCDGSIDEGLPGSATYYEDADGDGYGNPDSTTTGCTAPTGYVSDDTDCDDTDASTNPGASEVGYDTKDNDCDGIQDEMVASEWTSWTVTGSHSSDYVGSGAILVHEDLNNDGDDELVVGSPYYDLSSSYTNTGLVGFHDIDTADLPADAADAYYRVYGGSSDMLGWAMDAENCDGGSYTEVAMSSPYDSSGGTYAGTIYVFDIYGETGYDFASTPAEGIIEGTSTDGHYGTSLAFGDMDGDGEWDLAGGAPGASSSRGRVYVTLHDDGYYSGTMDARDGSYYIRGVSNSDGLGSSVAFGDFNDDGYDDLVACSPGDDDGGSDAGTCWIDFGSNSPNESDETVNNVDDVVITGNAAGANLGGTSYGLAVGDFDDDGVDDLAVGVDGYSSVASLAGAVAIWKGGSLSGSETLSTADWLIRGGTTSGYLGYSVHFGDITGDGVDDLLTGAIGDGSSAEGVLYLFAGGASTGTWDLPADQYASWSGPSGSSYFGWSIGGQTDLDGDGTDDFAVSAPYSDESATNGGEVFVLPTY